MLLKPASVEELQEAVRAHARVLPRGGGTKPALSTPAGEVVAIDVSAICGVVEYEPGEFTFTALAGTRIADINSLLRSHGQYLPFDPPFAERGATLGGTVAAGISGPARYRYGGVRDFLLGVRYVDCEGEIVRSGGKVVKNAAGFDISKLMVGSLGQLGLLIELTFKVFPEPAAYLTLRVPFPSLEAALEGLYRLYGSGLDLDALDLVPEAGGATLWLRLGGLPTALPGRAERIQTLVGGDIIAGAREAEIWRSARDMAWAPEGWSLVKVPLTPARIPALEAARQSDSGAGDSSPSPLVEGLRREARARYSAGGQVAWLALPGGEEELDRLDRLLASQRLAGLVVFGPPGRPRLGARSGAALAQRVKAALDPRGRFVEV